ncbi:MAG TPA: xanthine dehydrogenase family protein subunit M [Prolixibacteraceae bacterium]|nr:xanthine dehydrogenase family protein subunit M [Prolixibacteraceae bacterium]
MSQFETCSSDLMEGKFFPSTRVFKKFELHQPTTLEKTLSLLATYGKKAHVFAGGTDLLIDMKDGEVRPEHVVSISGIPNLSFIEHDEQGLRIGALTTLRDIENSKVIKDKYLLLQEAVCTMGSVQVRNIATIGGNICKASPAADTAVPLLALDAQVKIANLAGERTWPLEKFFIGAGKTSFESGELLIGIQVPPLPENTGTSFLKISKSAVGSIAKLSVAVVLRVANGICEDVRIALGAVASTPIRAREVERALKGKRVDDTLIEKVSLLAAEAVQPSSVKTTIRPHRTTFEYRKTVCPVIVKRALKKALERTDYDWR